MCVRTACQHDSDPGVKWLEREYIYMAMSHIAPPWWDDPFQTTVAVDSRDGSELSMRHRGPSAVQPVFTLKSVADHTAWVDAATWSTIEGPCLPWEEDDMHPGIADRDREVDGAGSYVVKLYRWYAQRGSVPDKLSEAYRAWKVAFEARRKALQAKWEREDEVRAYREQHRLPLPGSFAPGGVIDVIPSTGAWTLDEVATFMGHGRRR